MSKEIIRNTDWAKYIVENFLPIIQTDQMKYKFPIELELICKGDNNEVERMLKKCGIQSFPCYANGDGNWYNGNPLNFGSVCGWDVTADGDFALCRVDFLDYRLFKVIKKSSVAKQVKKKNDPNNLEDIEQMKGDIKFLKDNLIEALKIIQSQGKAIGELRQILTEAALKIIKSQVK